MPNMSNKNLPQHKSFTPVREHLGLLRSAVIDFVEGKVYDVSREKQKPLTVFLILYTSLCVQKGGRDGRAGKLIYMVVREESPGFAGHDGG